jgi:hypothetical protein
VAGSGEARHHDEVRLRLTQRYNTYWNNEWVLDGGVSFSEAANDTLFEMPVQAVLVWHVYPLLTAPELLHVDYSPEVIAIINIIKTAQGRSP